MLAWLGDGVLKMATKRVLFIFTQANVIPLADNRQTGWYLPEAAHPYDVLVAAGYEVEFATPAGGSSDVDLSSVEAFKDDASSVAFLEKFVTDGHLSGTKRVSDLNQSDYDAVVYPGGHGPMFDLATDDAVAAWSAKFYEERGGVLAAVCHGPAALIPITLSNGDAVIKGKEFVAFSDAEETAVSLHDKMPFLLESKLKEQGGKSIVGAQWAPTVAVADRVITGQNPASAHPFGEAIVEKLKALSF